MEVELFAIRCRINQATCIPGISHIIIITNVLHVVRKIFDSAIHPYQIQLIMILKDLQIFFNGHLNNIVEFWDCPSDKKCHLHAQVNKDMKKFDFILLYPNKISWGFSKKEEYDNIIKEWWEEFKLSNLKRRNFLNLLNNDHSNIKPSYMKERLWIEHFRFSNSLCTQATQAITNHALIGKYYLLFFPREDFSCPYRLYPIKTRCYILFDCRWFNKGWNLGREIISQFISFLMEYNLNAFSFGESITWVHKVVITTLFSFILLFIANVVYSFLVSFSFLSSLFFLFPWSYLIWLCCSYHGLPSCSM